VRGGRETSKFSKRGEAVERQAFLQPEAPPSDGDGTVSKKIYFGSGGREVLLFPREEGRQSGEGPSLGEGASGVGTATFEKRQTAEKNPSCVQAARGRGEGKRTKKSLLHFQLGGKSPHPYLLSDRRLPKRGGKTSGGSSKKLSK